jgi:hypothetical protein
MVELGIPFMANIDWLLLANLIGVYYEFIVTYFKPCLTLFSPNYSWFKQYMKSDNGVINIIQFPLGVNSFYT